MKHQEPVQMKGRNVDDAINAALQVLGAQREEVEVKVLNEGKTGMLGIVGNEEAEVEVSIKVEAAQKAQAILQGILDKMGFLALVEDPTKEDDVIKLNIKGEDMGRIIGKEGFTLDALQSLVVSILNNGKTERVRVVVDAEGYRVKADAKIVRQAMETVDMVVKSGEERELPPLNARERRAVHMALKDNAKVTSFSRGEGITRRLVIAPKTK